MPKWLKRVRGAIGMGLVWGLGWAVVGGGIMEAFVDPDGKILDMWPQALGVVGFLGGLIFSTVLGIAAGRRKFEELSLTQFTGLGALGGVLLGALGVLTGGPAVFVAVATLGSAVAALSTLLIARKAERSGLLGASSDLPDAELTESETRKLL